MAEVARPEGYGRRPDDGPEVTRAELNRRERDALNRTNNGVMKSGQKQPFITPKEFAA